MNFGPEHIDLSHVQFTTELLRCIPVKLALKYRVMPVYQNEDRIGIATDDPGDLNTVDSLVHLLNQEIELFVVDKNQLDTFIERYYGASN